MTDQKVRDFLERMAAEEPTPFLDAAALTRRARRRATRTIVVGAVGLAVTVAVLFTGVVKIRSAPGPIPADTPPTTRPCPSSGRFDSSVHGISFDCPAGWLIRPATEPWSGGQLTFESPSADVIFDPALGDSLYFVLASQPFEGPTEAQDWDGTAPGDWNGLNDVPLCLPGEGGHGLGGPFPVDDGRAFQLQACGSFAAAVNWADTRGYVVALIVRDESGLRETYDSGYFDAALEKVDLRPEEAVEAP
jgi:hypothetical protein